MILKESGDFNAEDAEGRRGREKAESRRRKAANNKSSAFRFLSTAFYFLPSATLRVLCV
jgi:hypothetical protein